MPNLRVLNLLPDDRKTLRHIVDVMETVHSGRNEFMAMPGAADTHSDGFEHPALRICDTLEQFEVRASAAAKRADAIILHSLASPMVAPVLARSSHTPVLWSVWGADLMNAVPLLQASQFLPRTAALRRDTRAARRADVPQASAATRLTSALIYRSVGPDYRAVAKRLTGRVLAAPWVRQIAQEIDYYASVEPVPELARAAPGFAADWTPVFKYYVVEPPKELVSGVDIMIGNRATWSCNHLEALEAVRRSGDIQGRIVLPLNYGDAEYGKMIEHRARALFGNRVLALREWMDFESYSKIVRKCGTLVLNQRRGQALGTSSLALAQGARVFFRSENTHYRFFKGLGAAVFAIDNRADKALLGAPLEAELQAQNRRVIAGNWSRAANLERASSIVDLLDRHSRSRGEFSQHRVV